MTDPMQFIADSITQAGIDAAQRAMTAMANRVTALPPSLVAGAMGIAMAHLQYKIDGAKLIGADEDPVPMATQLFNEMFNATYDYLSKNLEQDVKDSESMADALRGLRAAGMAPPNRPTT